jgi:hypothetical protein
MGDGEDVVLSSLIVLISPLVSGEGIRHPEKLSLME